MNIRIHLAEAVARALAENGIEARQPNDDDIVTADPIVAQAETGIEARQTNFTIEKPAKETHGDFSTNAALAAAKQVGRKPRDLAQDLTESLKAQDILHVRSIEIAGAGFINFFLHPSWLHETLAQIVSEGAKNYARSALGTNKSVNIEYVSANPTGPLHAGHGRWAAYGDALARLFERCGYEVTREFYVNDRGRQTELFAASLEARKNSQPPPEDGYHGDYLITWAKEMPADADPLEWGLSRAKRDQREVLAAMNCHFDHWSSERKLASDGQVEKTLHALAEADQTYEDKGATWLRTTDFGDTQDRVLIKSDQQPTYFLPDIAYHMQKYDRGDLLIDIWGSDHHGYVGRMAAAVQMMGKPKDSFEAIIGQNVTLIKDGAEVSLSKRAGNIVEARELIDFVGADSARLSYLMQSIDTKLTINIDKVVAEASENPVFYVQYANARVHSLARTAKQRNIALRPIAEVDLSVLTHPRELALLEVLAELPTAVERATIARAPHQIASWSRECAGALHGFWHDCQILRDDIDPAIQQARMWLVEATRIGLGVGLELLGVSAPESM